MATVKVKAIEDQMFDVENQVRRKAGESFEVKSSYAAQLEAEGLVEISDREAKKIEPSERVSAELNQSEAAQEARNTGRKGGRK